MIFSKRSLRFAFTIVTAVGSFQLTTAEDVVPTNLRRSNLALDEAIPLGLQNMTSEANNADMDFHPQQEQASPTQGQSNELKITVTNSTCVTTSIVTVTHSRTNTVEEFLSCDTANGNHYKVAGVSDEIIQANKQLIMNGDVELSLPDGAYLNGATATVEMPITSKNTLQFFKESRGKDEDKNITKTETLFDRTRRSLAATGTRSVLVVRIVASNAAPSLSEATLSNSVFGNGADGTVDTVTMKSHYSTCSHGQLTFVQAADRNGRTARIRKGAVTVTVPYSATRDDWGGLANAVNAELNSQFGVTNPSQLANHRMYFLPPGVIPGIALGYVGGDLTLFDDGWTGASGHMHEIGHNLGMLHSGEGNGEYEDESCIMGGGFSDDGPLLCFNAAKSWQMGWYNSRNHVYNVADGIWNGRLIGQVDYANGNDSSSKVILKLNTSGRDDYYVMFNRMKSGMKESKDLVLISVAGEEGMGASQSNLVAKLGSGESTIFPYFHMWESIELTVNKIDLNANPAYADVTVKLGCLHNCGATLDTWTDISGESIADLMSSTNNLASTPQMSERLQNVLEAPSNVNDNYGSRMSGWLVAPATGDYVFWIASDNNGELWLSTDDDPANKILVCHQPSATSSRQWDKYPEQKSGTISLVAGQAYYYEALMKEGGWADNLAIAWQYPGKARDVISAESSRVINPFRVVGANLDSWIGIRGESIADLRSGTNNLSNPVQLFERLQNVLEAPSNVNDNYGSRMSGWLVPPVTGDYVFWIASDDNGELWFSTDDDPANKILVCHQPFATSSRWWDKYAEQKSGTISLVAGQAYYYEALMKEGGGADNLAIAWQYPGQPREVIPARFSRSELTWMTNWGVPSFGAKLDTWTGISGISIAELMSGTNNLANPPQKSEFLFMSLEAPSNRNDNYGSRMSGWLVPPVTGDYVFWIASDDNGEFWLSTDDDPANVFLACHQPLSASSREWDKYVEQKSGLISLVSGQAYYYEAFMKEEGWADNFAIAWQYPGQPRVVIPAKFSRLEPKIEVIQRPPMPTPDPTPSPTPIPTLKPTSRKPTLKPTSPSKPTLKPTSRKPTVKPVSSKPSPKPISKSPTRKPI